MTPADRRITELIDKWLASIDLHLKYVELSDAAYARAQAWPKHDRPTRWVLEVARQKILELKAHCETRQAMGDSKFSESLELMAFLANLVGIQHIQRFVPLADPTRTEPVSSTTATVEIVQPPRAAPAPKARPSGDDTTREMPRIKSTLPPPAQSAPTPAPARAASPRTSISTEAYRRCETARASCSPCASAAERRGSQERGAERRRAGQDHCGRHSPAEMGQVLARAGGAHRAHRRAAAGRRDSQGAARQPQRNRRRRPRQG